MPIIYMDRYGPNDCKEHPDWYFVFGDNMLHKGNKGQACIRNEPNAIGIPTKWAPGRLKLDYFTDNNAPTQSIDFALDQIETRLKQGHRVVLPADGIGTGLAELPTRAPCVYRYIKEILDQFEVGYRYR